MGVKVAFIGAGSMMPEHLKAYQDISHVELAGIFNRTTEKAIQLAEQFAIQHTAKSIAELYEKTQADLVVVAVAELAMKEIALACCPYPWTVFLEKPTGYCLQQALEIAEAAQTHQTNMIVGLNRRFLSSSLAVKEALAKDEGKRFIHVQDQQSFATAKHFNHPDIIVQHWMYANSIHLIDYLSYFGRGEIIEVKPLHQWNEKNSILLAHILFSSGDEGLYEAIWEGPGPWAVSITTPSQRWEMRPLETATVQKTGSRDRTTIETSIWDKQFKPGFRYQAEEAIKAATKLPYQNPDMQENLKTMQLINQIYGK